MAAVWPLGLGKSPESKNGDEKAASEGTVDEEADGSKFAGRPSRWAQPPTSTSPAGSQCLLHGTEH